MFNFHYEIGTVNSSGETNYDGIIRIFETFGDAFKCFTGCVQQYEHEQECVEIFIDKWDNNEDTVKVASIDLQALRGSKIQKFKYLFTFEFCTGDAEYYFSKAIDACNDLEACNGFLEVIGIKKVASVESFLELDNLEDDNGNIFKNINYNIITEHPNLNISTPKINTIKTLERQGYQGIDKSLEISLFEYGLIWRPETEQEFQFIYKVAENKYDYAFFSNEDYDSLLEDSWFKLEDILNFVGTTKEKFNELPLPQRIFNIISYYGYETVFGSCYNGIEIAND